MVHKRGAASTYHAAAHPLIIPHNGPSTSQSFVRIFIITLTKGNAVVKFAVVSVPFREHRNFLHGTSSRSKSVALFRTKLAKAHQFPLKFQNLFRIFCFCCGFPLGVGQSSPVTFPVKNKIWRRLVTWMIGLTWAATTAVIVRSRVTRERWSPTVSWWF